MSTNVNEKIKMRKKRGNFFSILINQSDRKKEEKEIASKSACLLPKKTLYKLGVRSHNKNYKYSQFLTMNKKRERPLDILYKIPALLILLKN